MMLRAEAALANSTRPTQTPPECRAKDWSGETA
jgi:hypothetical protein